MQGRGQDEPSNRQKRASAYRRQTAKGQADVEDQRYVLTQMQKLVETEKLISAVKGRPEMSSQIYAASLMAIESGTSVVKGYQEKLASGLDLTSEMTRHIVQMVGLQPV